MKDLKIFAAMMLLTAFIAIAGILLVNIEQAVWQSQLGMFNP